MSGKARAAHGAEARDVREQLLEAAMAILHEDGIQGLSQVRVARRAKVRQSHLTYYFPRRCDLLEAVAVRFVDGVVRRIGEAAARGAPGDTGAKLRRIAEAITDSGHMRMFVGVITEADSDPEVRAVVLRETGRVQSALAELLGGKDATVRAALTLAAFWGLGLYDLVFQLPAARRSVVMRSLLACLGESRARPRSQDDLPRRDARRPRDR